MKPRTNRIEVEVNEHSTKIVVDGVELNWVKSITLHQDGDVPLASVTIELWTEDAIINGEMITTLKDYQFKGKRNKKFVDEVRKENGFLEEKLKR